MDELQSTIFEEDEWLSSPEVDHFLKQHNLNALGIDPKLIGNSSQRLHLLHKPRGSKGAYCEIDAETKIRVSRAAGKKMKLHCSTFPHEYDRNTLEVLLFEVIGTESLPSKFEIESVKMPETLIEVEVKIFEPGKKLFFRLRIKTKNGEILEYKSVQFSTHNSGTRDTQDSNIDDDEISTIPPNEKKIKRSFSPPSPHPPVEPIQNSKKTIIPNSLQVNGSVKAKAFVQFSDLRLKTNIEDIQDALNIVTQMQGKRFEWKSSELKEHQGSKKVIGLIAQEVERVLPEVVQKDPDTGYLSVSYTEILPLLIEAFKQFIASYESDKAEVKEELTLIREKLDNLSLEQEEKQSKQTKTIETSQQEQFFWFLNQKLRQPRFFTKLILIMLFIVCFICLLIGIVLVASSDSSSETSVSPPGRPNDDISEDLSVFENGKGNKSVVKKEKKNDSQIAAGITLIVLGSLGCVGSLIGLLYVSKSEWFKKKLQEIKTKI